MKLGPAPRTGPVQLGLENIEAGFELWTGGQGLTTTQYAVGGIQARAVMSGAGRSDARRRGRCDQPAVAMNDEQGG